MVALLRADVTIEQKATGCTARQSRSALHPVPAHVIPAMVCTGGRKVITIQHDTHLWLGSIARMLFGQLYERTFRWALAASSFSRCLRS